MLSLIFKFLNFRYIRNNDDDLVHGFLVNEVGAELLVCPFLLQLDLLDHGFIVSQRINQLKQGGVGLLEQLIFFFLLLIRIIL